MNISIIAFLVSCWIVLLFSNIRLIGFSSSKDNILLTHIKDSSISLASLLLSISKRVFTLAMLVLKIGYLLSILGILFLTM